MHNVHCTIKHCSIAQKGWKAQPNRITMPHNQDLPTHIDTHTRCIIAHYTIRSSYFPIHLQARCLQCHAIKTRTYCTIAHCTVHLQASSAIGLQCHAIKTSPLTQTHTCDYATCLGRTGGLRVDKRKLRVVWSEKLITNIIQATVQSSLEVLRDIVGIVWALYLKNCLAAVSCIILSAKQWIVYFVLWWMIVHWGRIVHGFVYSTALYSLYYVVGLCIELCITLHYTVCIALCCRVVHWFVYDIALYTLYSIML